MDVFPRQDYVNIMVESLKFYHKEMGLKICVWVVMRKAASPNHLHLIIQSEKGHLSDIIWDFKPALTLQYPASKIIRAIENNPK